MIRKYIKIAIIAFIILNLLTPIVNANEIAILAKKESNITQQQLTESFITLKSLINGDEYFGTLDSDGYLIDWDNKKIIDVAPGTYELSLKLKKYQEYKTTINVPKPTSDLPPLLVSLTVNLVSNKKKNILLVIVLSTFGVFIVIIGYSLRNRKQEDRIRICPNCDHVERRTKAKYCGSCGEKLN